MLGGAPLAVNPLAALASNVVVSARPEASNVQAYWRVRSTIRLIRQPNGLHQAAIQRRVSLYGVRRRGTVALIPPPAPGTPEVPTRQLIAERLRFIITYKLAKKPWHPPRRSTHHAQGMVASSGPHVSWLGAEVVHGGQPSARVTWVGLEILRSTASGPTLAVLTWFGVEVLRSVGNYPFPLYPFKRRQTLQKFSFKRKPQPRPRRMGHSIREVDSGFVYLICG